MRKSKGDRCERYREQLIEWRAESQEQRFEKDLGDHLATCPSCRSFRAALSGLQPAFELPEFYSSRLKSQTLQRLIAQVESADRQFLGVMIPMSFMSLLVWFAIPLLTLAWLLNYWLVRPWLSLLVSLFFLSSVGFLVGCVAFLTLTEGKGADQVKRRMKELLEGDHA